ncbi:hypothetical protein [Sphingomonas sp. RS2018]
MTAMAAANPWWKRAWAGLWASLKSQWLAGALLIPIGFLIVNAIIANQQAREARVQAVNVDRISKVQESGKALDAALAGYFQAVAELGLAERHLRMPGTYKDIPVPQAQVAVVEARKEARKVLAQHAGDIQGLRGTFEQDAADRYMTALAQVSSTVEGEADINRTPDNIKVLGKLVYARNAMIDQAMKKVG